MMLIIIPEAEVRLYIYAGSPQDPGGHKHCNTLKYHMKCNPKNTLTETQIQDILGTNAHVHFLQIVLQNVPLLLKLLKM